MSDHLLLFFMCAGKVNRVTEYSACLCRMRKDGAVSRTTVKARVLSLQSRSRVSGHKWTMRYVSTIPLTGAVRGSSAQEWRLVLSQTEVTVMTTRVTLARHGHSVGYVSAHVSPSLYPGFHYIRSTKGSSYRDDALHAHTGDQILRPNTE